MKVNGQEDYETQPQRGKRMEPNQRIITAISAVLVAIAGALGGYGAYTGGQLSTDPNARPDPWTGTMAREQEQRIMREHEEDMSIIRAAIISMQDQIRELEACKHRVEEKLRQGGLERQRIIDILERVHPRVTGSR